MAELRYVTIPKSVDVLIENLPYAFINCVCYVVDTHALFAQTAAAIRAGARIIKIVDGRKPGDVVVLDEADWSLINQAFESPTASGYCPPLLRDNPRTGQPERALIPPRMFLPYIDAVSDESTKKLPETHAMQNGVAMPLPPASAA